MNGLLVVTTDVQHHMDKGLDTMPTLVSAWSCDMQNPRPCARGFLHVCSNQLCNGAMWWVLSMVLIACFIASRRSGQAVNHLSPWRGLILPTGTPVCNQCPRARCWACPTCCYFGRWPQGGSYFLEGTTKPLAELRDGVEGTPCWALGGRVERIMGPVAV